MSPVSLQRPLVIITGATATGKSEIAERLAERHNGVIINGDMGQMYSPLAIGTAKPAWKTATVPHYLFDIIEEPRNSSALHFRHQVHTLLKELSLDKVPFVVGGSLFHLKMLLYNLGTVPSPSQLCTPSIAHADSLENPHQLWEQLLAIDPQRAQALHPHDTYRVRRALAISRYQLPSACGPQLDPVTHNTMIIQITRPREELYNRINSRVHSMLCNGWVNEVRMLNTAWRQWLLAKKIIGYDTIIRDLSRDPGLTELPLESIAMIQQRTRNYAKRQLTHARQLSGLLRETDNSLVTYHEFPVDDHVLENISSIMPHNAP